jgi:hypothetical protein
VEDPASHNGQAGTAGAAAPPQAAMTGAPGAKPAAGKPQPKHPAVEAPINLCSSDDEADSEDGATTEEEEKEFEVSAEQSCPSGCITQCFVTPLQYSPAATAQVSHGIPTLTVPLAAIHPKVPCLCCAAAHRSRRDCGDKCSLRGHSGLRWRQRYVWLSGEGEGFVPL